MLTSSEAEQLRRPRPSNMTRWHGYLLKLRGLHQQQRHLGFLLSRTPAHLAHFILRDFQT